MVTCRMRHTACWRGIHRGLTTKQQSKGTAHSTCFGRSRLLLRNESLEDASSRVDVLDTAKGLDASTASVFFREPGVQHEQTALIGIVEVPWPG